MAENYFDPLLDVELPKIQIADAIGSGSIATGPFAVVHNGIRSLGAYLHQYEDIVAFLDSSIYRSLTQSYKYEIDKKNNKITFYYEPVDSKFEIEPIVPEDMKEFYPDKKFQDFGEFISFLERLAQYITFGQGVELTDYAITVDSGAVPPSVMGLFLRKEGKFYRREGKNWVEVTTADEDWIDIEGYTWINVLSGAISLYDSQENEEQISIIPFESYIAEGRTL